MEPAVFYPDNLLNLVPGSVAPLAMVQEPPGLHPLPLGGVQESLCAASTGGGGCSPHYTLPHYCRAATTLHSPPATSYCTRQHGETDN